VPDFHTEIRLRSTVLDFHTYWTNEGFIPYKMGFPGRNDFYSQRFFLTQIIRNKKISRLGTENFAEKELLLIFAFHFFGM